MEIEDIKKKGVKFFKQVKKGGEEAFEEIKNKDEIQKAIKEGKAFVNKVGKNGEAAYKKFEASDFVQGAKAGIEEIQSSDWMKKMRKGLAKTARKFAAKLESRNKK